MAPTGASNVVLQAVLLHAHHQVNPNLTAAATTTATLVEVTRPIQETPSQNNKEKPSA